MILTSLLVAPLYLALASTPPSNTYMDFGGMYGYASGGRVYANPYTGLASCPAGYTATPVVGTTGVDFPLMLCGRVTSGGTLPLADFGGMFGYGRLDGSTATFQFNNPITGGFSCPAGYYATQVLGNETSIYDYPLYYCHRPHVPGSYVYYRLGGMFGNYGNGTTTARYPNPVTGNNGCSFGYTRTQMWGAFQLDYKAFFCHLPMLRPTFTAEPATPAGCPSNNCATLTLNNITYNLGCNTETANRTFFVSAANASPACNLLRFNVTRNGVLARSTSVATDHAKLRFTRVNSDTLQVRFEESENNDFNDLVINLRGLSGLNYGVENSTTVICY